MNDGVSGSLLQTPDFRRMIEAAVEPIREQAAERIASDEAAGLRTRLDQLQGMGLWARIRNKR